MQTQARTGTPTKRPGPKGPTRRPQPKKQSKKKNKAFDTFLVVYIVALFVGVFTILIFWPDTIITVKTIFRSIGILGIVCLGVALPFSLRKNEKGVSYLKEIGVPFFIGLNLAGGGLFLTGLGMALNDLGKSDEIITEYHKLGDRDKRYVAGSYTGIVFHYAGLAYEDEVDLRWFDLSSNLLVRRAESIKLEFQEGLFGYRIFKRRGIVTKENGTDEKIYIEVPLIGDGF